VPHIIEDLLGREMVTAPPLDMNISSPLAAWGGMAEGRPMVICCNTPCYGSPNLSLITVILVMYYIP
jgi:hypothetical protein